MIRLPGGYAAPRVLHDMHLVKEIEGYRLPDAISILGMC